VDEGARIGGVKGGQLERRVRHCPRRCTAGGHVADAACARAERAWARSGRGVRSHGARGSGREVELSGSGGFGQWAK
jgi:hypothetical protein